MINAAYVSEMEDLFSSNELARFGVFRELDWPIFEPFVSGAVIESFVQAFPAFPLKNITLASDPKPNLTPFEIGVPLKFSRKLVCRPTVDVNYIVNPDTMYCWVACVAGNKNIAITSIASGNNNFDYFNIDTNFTNLLMESWFSSLDVPIWNLLFTVTVIFDGTNYYGQFTCNVNGTKYGSPAMEWELLEDFDPAWCPLIQIYLGTFAEPRDITYRHPILLVGAME